MKNLLLKFKKENILILIVMILTGIATSLSSFISAQIINSLVQLDFNAFWKSIFLLIGTYLIFLLCKYIQVKLTSKTVQKMSKSLRNSILRRSTIVSPVEFKKNTVGNYTSWLTNDIAQIEQGGLLVFYELLANIINLTVALVSLLFIHWSVFILTVIIMLLIIQIPKLRAKKMRELTLNVSQNNERLSTRATELFTGYSTFYLLSNTSFLKKELTSLFSDLELSKNKQSYLLAKIIILGGLGNIIGQVSSYALSGYLILNSVISVGLITTTTSLNSTIFNTVGNLSQYITSIKSIEPLLDKIYNFNQDYAHVRNEKQEVTRIKKGIELSDLSFSYDKNKKLLDKINFLFEPNKNYAIVGNSGTGKSTLMNILNGTLTNYSGTLTLDGEDYRNTPIDKILSAVLHIEQTPYIFKGTVRDNIQLNNNFTDLEIKKALIDSGLEEYSEQLDFEISELGSNVSGGQKQRFSLARGLIRNKQIILLDESTSNLDKTTASNIENFILDIPNVTVIMITHHLSEKIKDRLDGILELS